MDASLRQAFLAKLVVVPASCPLEARGEGRVGEAGYARERVSYLASPGVRVPAWLLVPEGLTGRAPAVLCVHQHAGEFDLGKSEPAGLAGDPDMAYARELCRRGYVALAPDLECFEERQAPPEERARWAAVSPHPPTGAEYERFVADRYLLQGSSLGARYVWDLARGVDYLETRPEVDRGRIGVLGHSLGGQETCWALLFDPRLKAGACSCGVGTFATILRDGVGHNRAAYVPGLLGVGDVDALIAALAPTPLLLTAGAGDRIFPIDGVRRIAQAASEAYRAAGAPDAFRLREMPGGHAFPADVRAEAYAWLDRWLKG